MYITNNGINIVIDESGTMGNNRDSCPFGWTNYFVIAGYATDDYGLKILDSNFLRWEQKIRKEKPDHYNKYQEIKGVNIIPSDCAKMLLSTIQNVKTFLPFSIVVCKEHLIRKDWNENGAFNYFLRILIKFLINDLELIKTKDVQIYLDNRGRKTPFNLELKEYLEQELYLDNQTYNFNLEYKDSKRFAYVRCADLIAYSILKTHQNKSKRDRKFIKTLNKYQINLNEIKTIFPKEKCQNNNCEIINIYTSYSRKSFFTNFFE